MDVAVVAAVLADADATAAVTAACADLEMGMGRAMCMLVGDVARFLVCLDTSAAAAALGDGAGLGPRDIGGDGVGESVIERICDAGLDGAGEPGAESSEARDERDADGVR